MGLFERDTDIYRDRDALREDYQPSELVGRDAELSTYTSALQPVINSEQPNNIFLYGKTGVGKTAATRYLLDHLREDAAQYDDVDLDIIFLNCDGLSSSYQVATHLVNELRAEHNQISTTGYPLATVYEMLWEDLDSHGGTVLIVLDEIDNIGDDSILYQLPRARANSKLESTQVGLIGISNDFSFRDDLSPKVKSSLCENEIHFPAYDATDLKAILEQRAEVAFHDGVLDPGVIPLCAAYGAKDAGDARQSIDLLMKAGDVARDDDAATVTEEHVDRGRTALERGRIEEGIRGLTEHGHLVLYALVTNALEGETPIRSRDVRPRYTRFAELANRDPLVPRRMRDHLSELAMLGIISVTERNEGRRGGTYREYELDMPVEQVLSALSETVELVGVHESVVERALEEAVIDDTPGEADSDRADTERHATDDAPTTRETEPSTAETTETVDTEASTTETTGIDESTTSAESDVDVESGPTASDSAGSASGRFDDADDRERSEDNRERSHAEEHEDGNITSFE